MIRALGAVIVAALLGAVLGIAEADAQDAQSEVVAREEVVVRDQLIANQESLLNVYRCLFDIDTYVVPDGCVEGKPARGPSEPQAFGGNATMNDLLVRDELIANQESLLNAYRCMFNVDTQLVPDRCAVQEPVRSVYSGELEMYGTSQMVDLMMQVGQLFKGLYPQVTTVGDSNGQFDWSRFCPDNRDDDGRLRFVGVDHQMPEAARQTCIDNRFRWVELPVAVEAAASGPPFEPQTFYLYMHDDIGENNFTEVAYVDFLLSDRGLDAVAEDAGVISTTEATAARSPLPGSLGEQYLLEDLATIAEIEGISLETAISTQKARDLIGPYINVVEEARTEDFAGFWWSTDQPHTANFATSGDADEFGQFVDMTIAHLDPEFRGIVRIIQAEISYEELKDLQIRAIRYMRAQGFRFDSGIYIQSGQVYFTVEPEFVDSFISALLEMPGLDADTFAEAIKVTGGGLSQPD